MSMDVFFWLRNQEVAFHWRQIKTIGIAALNGMQGEIYNAFEEFDGTGMSAKFYNKPVIAHPDRHSNPEIFTFC
jgi:hypothetical protein